MSYRQLERFDWIFSMEEFTFIHKNTDLVCDKIRYPSQDSIEILTKYKNNIINFYNKSGLSNIVILKVRVSNIIQKIDTIINNFSNLSGSYRRKFRKNLLYELSEMAKVIEMGFSANTISSTDISDEAIRRFILDPDVGYGTKYVFNCQGKNSFVESLNSFNRKELITTLRFLEAPTNTRTFGGWTDIGSKSDAVRILAVRKSFRIFVYFAFRTKSGGHEKYVDFVHRRPEEFTFRKWER